MLLVTLVCPTSCLTGEKFGIDVLQRSAQVTSFVELQPALAKNPDGSQVVLFGLVSFKEKFYPDISTILGQTQTVGRRSKIHFIDESEEEGPDLHELLHFHTTVHQEDNVCKLLLDRKSVV